jgi:hypothetical protein
LAGRPTPAPAVPGERLLALRPSPSARLAAVHGHPVLVHPAGQVFAVDLGATVAVLEGAGLVVTWAELDATADDDALRVAVRAAFRQASRMAG